MAGLHRRVFSGNLALAAVTPVNIKKQGNTWLVDYELKRPLVLLFEYMNAKPKHIDKFIDFYHQKRMDVLTVNLKPWQLFLPTRGSQVVAKELADFLLANPALSPILYHGFSVGGYLWGELLHLCLQTHPKYLPVTERVRGQILDSGVDVNEIPTAFPKAALPNNPIASNAFQKLIRFHMTTFYNESTRHYIAARKAVTEGLIRGPVLQIFSDSDVLSTPAINQRCANEWAAKNISVRLKQFHGSKHVMHYQRHPEEYLQEITSFLKEIDLNPESQPSTHHEHEIIAKSKL